MADPLFQIPATEAVEVDLETLAAIDRGIKDADAGRTVSLEQAQQMARLWITKFESPKQR